MTFIAFGITGDHMRLKILPALFALHLHNELGGMRIAGVSRKGWNDADLRAYVKEVVPGAGADFFERFFFVQGDVADAASFAALEVALGGEPALAYLSISPRLYAPGLDNLESMGLPKGSRVVVEKPLGRSGEEAENLWAQLTRIADERDVFLVDHFLAKEWVRELQPAPGARRVTLRYLETLGVEERGEAYDSLGALRDVVQNHLLQALARVVPSALEELPTLSRADVISQTVRAQYTGYQNIAGVAPDSQTETYAKVAFILGDIEITLEAGKRMPEARKEAVLGFADGREAVFSDRPNIIPEYEVLLRSALRREHDLFVPIHDVRAQWRFADAILGAWSAGMPPLLSYEPGTSPV